MEYLMNKDIKEEIDVLINKIKSSDIYIKYSDLLNKVNKSETINNLVDEIRNLEKQLVRTPSISLEEKLKIKEKELNEIPLYLDYKEKLIELDNMLLLVKDSFDKFINNL